jgi:tetratricopeptide (TPR) repeat protein
MDRERDISRRLPAADREHARQLFADGFALGQAENYDAARKGFEEGLAIDPANSQANYMLGYILVQQRQFDGARGRFARAIYFAPKSAEATAAKAAMKKLPALETSAPLQIDMSSTCRPLVENFIAAGQKNDGPAAKSAYDALHAAGGCGVASEALLTADLGDRPPAAQTAPGPSTASKTDIYIRLISLGLEVAQDIENARQQASAGAGPAPRVVAAAPPAPTNVATAAKNPFANKNVFAAKAPAVDNTPPAQAAGPPTNQKCQGLVQNLVNAAKANDGPGAKASYDALQQAGGCGVVSTAPSSPVTPAPDPRFAARGDTPMIDQTFGACDQQPERCDQVANQLKAGTSSAAIAALYANAIGIGLQLGAGMAQGMASMQQPQMNVRVPSGRQTDMRSLAAPPIRNGVGQGAPTYTYKPPPPTTQPTITGTTN